MQLIGNIVNKSINELSEPIKVVIITASIIAEIIILLIAYKYFVAKDNEQANKNMAVNLQLHPHIWKKYDKHYKNNNVTPSS